MAHLVDDHRRTEPVGELHGFFGGRDAAVQLVRHVVAAAGLERDRCHPQIQLIQQRPQFAQTRVGECAGRSSPRASISTAVAPNWRAVAHRAAARANADR